MVKCSTGMSPFTGICHFTVWLRFRNNSEQLQCHMTSCGDTLWLAYSWLTVILQWLQYCIYNTQHWIFSSAVVFCWHCMKNVRTSQYTSYISLNPCIYNVHITKHLINEVSIHWKDKCRKREQTLLEQIQKTTKTITSYTKVLLMINNSYWWIPTFHVLIDLISKHARLKLPLRLDNSSEEQ